MRGDCASSVSLPKLYLKPFGGNITEWNQFWDEYKQSIHLNPTLTRVQKFNYLVSYLQGVAYKSIQGLSVTEENYEQAISILKERFSDNQKIINAHMDKLFNIKPVHNLDVGA